MTAEELAAIHADAMRVPAPWSPAAIRDLLQQKGVFLTTKPTIGFALGRTVLDEVELLTLAVARPFQGKGHGRTILTDFERVAIQSGAVHAHLEVAETNLAAQHLYTSSNWRLAGRRKAYYRGNAGREDALLYSKVLQPA